MTDTTVVPGAEPAAPVVDSSATANLPGVDPVGGGDDSLNFDNNQFQDWLDHGFSSGAEDGDEGEQKPIVPASAGAAPTPAAPNADTSAGTGDGTGGTGQTAPQAAPADPDAALVAQMLLGTEAPAPTAQPQPAPAAPAPSAAAETPRPATESAAAFAPLPEVVNVPPALAAAIFESDDPNARVQALGRLLGAYGNAILTLADKRMTEHHRPAVLADFTSASQRQNAVAEVQKDFYGAFPDLQAYPQIVQRAFKIIEQTNPTATYGKEVRDKAGNLARRTLVQMGLIQAQPAAQPAAAPAAPGVRAKPVTAVGFEAGGARPSGAGTTSRGDSPADLVAQLSEFS